MIMPLKRTQLHPQFRFKITTDTDTGATYTYEELVVKLEKCLIDYRDWLKHIQTTADVPEHVLNIYRDLDLDSNHLYDKLLAQYNKGDKSWLIDTICVNISTNIILIENFSFDETVPPEEFNYKGIELVVL